MKKNWVPSPPSLIRSFENAVAPLRGVTHRKMFGYPSVCVNGNMVAGLIRDRMVLRLGDADRENFLRLPGAEPFIAMGHTMKSWAMVPRGMVRSGATLKKWCARALANGRRLPPKSARKSREAKPARRPSRSGR
jgi:TfoX/Sxy family transcriptional regulator of competence genes